MRANESKLDAKPGNRSVYRLKMLRKSKGHLPTVAETWMMLFQALKRDSW